MARARVKYVAGALREHHDSILEALQLLYKALEARDAEALYKLVKFAQASWMLATTPWRSLSHGAVRGGFPYGGGPIQVMVCEHGVGRFLARRMEELYLAWRSGDEGAFAELLDAARLYADHLAQHIDKENGVLFPVLEANIREVETGKTVEDVERESRHEEWLKTLEEAKRRLGAMILALAAALMVTIHVADAYLGL